MQGTNTLELNQATINEAVQQYLDRELAKPVKVLDVAVVTSALVDDRTFKVTVEHPPIAPSGEEG